MTNKTNFKVLAASLCVASATFGTTIAQADSLLAPLVISDIANGFETTLSFKVRGTGTPNLKWNQLGNQGSEVSSLHYIWLKKGTTIGSFFNRTKGCEHVDNNGVVSPWDMVNQSINTNLNFLAQTQGTDQTTTNHPATPFYGMAVLDDVASLDKSEGNSSGFAYVINYFTGMMLDYKLVNNHKSSTSGDFSIGFARKSSVDLSWNPINRDLTLWLAIATGKGMTSGDGWAGKIKISQQTNTALAHQLSPKVPHGGDSGVYNHDEVNISGDTAIDITCMGMFTRDNFMSQTQRNSTVNGGWTRKSLVGSDGATGGMVYKAELKLIPTILSQSAVASFQPETSGHLSSKGTDGVPHPNRPY